MAPQDSERGKQLGQVAERDVALTGPDRQDGVEEDEARPVYLRLTTERGYRRSAPQAIPPSARMPRLPCGKEYEDPGTCEIQSCRWHTF